ncbi:MAG: hypothetical protein KIT82_23130 [Bradyrhizobium sp.]|nr:hypothetical protein [Bradyrhizobium sp.]
MTPRQIELARHALGLRPGTLVSYRNNFCAGPGHDDFEEWEAMVAAGFARKRSSAFLPPGDVLFHLTRAGAERALLPGDVLDPEDWK